MIKPREALATVLILITPLVFGCSSTSKQESKSLSFSETKSGDGLVVAMSDSLAQSLVEGVVGADLECGAEMDSDFAVMLRELDRGGRGSRSTLADGDGKVVAWRSGRSLKMKIYDSDDGGRLEVKMPWAVAECLLDGSATLSSKDAGAVRVKVVGSEGGSFEFKVD